MDVAWCRAGCALTCTQGLLWFRMESGRKGGAPKSDSPYPTMFYRGTPLRCSRIPNSKTAFQSIMKVYLSRQEDGIYFIQQSPGLVYTFLNIHTYVSEPLFAGTLTLGPENLKHGPDWNFLYLLVFKTALPDFFKCDLSLKVNLMYNPNSKGNMQWQFCLNTALKQAFIYLLNTQEILQLYEGFKIYPMVYFFFNQML